MFIFFSAIRFLASKDGSDRAKVSLTKLYHSHGRPWDEALDVLKEEKLPVSDQVTIFRALDVLITKWLASHS